MRRWWESPPFCGFVPGASGHVVNRRADAGRPARCPGLPSGAYTSPPWPPTPARSGCLLLLRGSGCAKLLLPLSYLLPSALPLGMLSTVCRMLPTEDDWVPKLLPLELSMLPRYEPLSPPGAVRRTLTSTLSKLLLSDLNEPVPLSRDRFSNDGPMYRSAASFHCSCSSASCACCSLSMPSSTSLKSGLWVGSPCQQRRSRLASAGGNDGPGRQSM
jgi:hypothetical protein